MHNSVSGRDKDKDKGRDKDKDKDQDKDKDRDKDKGRDKGRDKAKGKAKDKEDKAARARAVEGAETVVKARAVHHKVAPDPVLSVALEAMMTRSTCRSGRPSSIRWSRD